VRDSLWRYWGPLLLYMGVIFYGSAKPRPDAVSNTPDFVLHGAAYFVLALLSIRALSRGLFHRASSLHLWGGVLIAIVYGASDEWHQSFVAGRVASVSDLAYDALGAMLAALVLLLFWRGRGLR